MTKVQLEGVLSKWTNYVSGWQQRWFTLNDGILSYYRSKEEMNSGCRGSVKMSVCDVIVHSTDARRFDLLLDEQRFYLRACSHTDRKRWVIALGSCKVGTPFIEPALELPGLGIQSEAIQKHQSELLLYHRLLVEQVKELQTQLKQTPTPDMTRIDDITGNLNATCSTYLSTLDELHSLAKQLSYTKQRPMTPTFMSPRQSRLKFDQSPSRSPRSLSKNDRVAGALNSWFPNSSSISTPTRLFNISRTSVGQRSRSTRTYRTFFSSMNFSFEDLRPTFNLQTMSRSNPQTGHHDMPGDFLSAWDFAQACRGLFSFFDKLNDITTTPTSLQQAQADVMGNLKRLELAVQVYAISKSQRIGSQPQTTTESTMTQSPRPDHTTVSIGAMIRNDVLTGRIRDDASSYQAILWLSRSLNFVREFLHLVFTSRPPEHSEPEDQTEDSLSGVATEAYTRCLRPFHPWTLRGVVMILIKSLPKRGDLIQLLLDNQNHDDNHNTDQLDSTDSIPSVADLKNDANLYGESIGRTLTLIEGLFASLDLERVFTGSESY